jgi:hypothetical protein
VISPITPRNSIHSGSKALKSTAAGLARVKPQARRRNDTRATASENWHGFEWGEKPLENEILNAAAGRNKPARSGAEETVEDVRNVEDGASARAGSNRGNPGKNPNGGAGAHVRAAPTEVAKRAKTPREALSGKPGGRRRLEDRQAREARQARKAGGWRRTLKGTKSSREDDPRPEKVGER